MKVAKPLYALVAILLAMSTSALVGLSQDRAEQDEKLAQAKNSQTGGGYKADDWKMIALKQGDVVYGGIPGQSEFYTTKGTVDASDLNAEKLFKSLQVKPHPKFGYRMKMQEYVVQKAVSVPYGKALANADLGPGGGEQYFIANFKDLLKPANVIELKK